MDLWREEIEKRLLVIEKQLGIKTPTEIYLEEKSIKQSFAPPQKIVEKKSKLNSSQILALVSVICFVLAGTFIVRLAIDSGWLTLTRQWFLLVLLGATLSGVGRFVEHLDLQLRSYLSAAGVIVLYIAAYASSLYFSVFPDFVSLILSSFVSLYALWLFHYHRSESFSIVSALGTFCSALLLPTLFENHSLSAAYFLIWSAVFCGMSTYFRSRTLSLVTSYFSLGIYALLNIQNVEAYPFVLLVEFLLFGIFAKSIFVYSQRNQTKLSAKEAWSYFPILCFYYGISYFFVSRIVPSLAPWLGLAFAFSLLGVYSIAQQKLEHLGELSSRELFHSFLAVVLFQAGYLEILPSSAKAWLLPTILLLSFVAEQRPDKRWISVPIRVLFLFVGGWELMSTCLSLLRGEGWNHVLSGIATVIVGFLYYSNYSSRLKARAQVFLPLVHLLAVLALYRVGDGLIGSLGVSFAWGLYASAVLGFGFLRRDKLLARSSLAVLTLSAAKVLLWDAAQAASSVRIFCLLLTGVLLFGAGLLMKKISLWENA